MYASCACVDNNTHVVLAGTVIVNGKPVEDMVALDDGTEVYTLERFLEENKHRLDEAFEFLSQQEAASQPLNGKSCCLPLLMVFSLPFCL